MKERLTMQFRVEMKSLDQLLTMMETTSPEFAVFDTETMGHLQAQFFSWLAHYIPHDLPRSPQAVLSLVEKREVTKLVRGRGKNAGFVEKVVKEYPEVYNPLYEGIAPIVESFTGKKPRGLGIQALENAWIAMGMSKSNGHALQPDKSLVYNLQVGAYYPSENVLYVATESSVNSISLQPHVIRLYNTQVPLVAQNADFDLRQCYQSFGVLPTDSTFIYDTKLIESLYNADSNRWQDVGLGDLAKLYNCPDEYMKVGISPVHVDWRNPNAEQLRYALNDIISCAWVFLAQRQHPEWNHYQKTFALESSIRTRLAYASVVGVPIKADVARAFMTTNITREAALLPQVFQKAIEVGILSPDRDMGNQNAQYLGKAEFKQRILDKINQETRASRTFDSLSKSKMWKHADFPSIPQPLKDMLTLFWEYNSTKKRISDMAKTIIPELGDQPYARLHPRYGSCPAPKSGKSNAEESDGGNGTKSGRFSTQGFNVLNRSEIEKQYVVAEPGRKIVSLDYSGIEVRVAASLSHDKNLIRIFNEGLDPYRVLAGQAFNMEPASIPKKSRERALGKEGVLAFIFDAQPFTLINQVRIRTKGEMQVSRPEADNMYDSWWRIAPELRDHNERVWIKSCVLGYTETAMGRKRKFNQEDHLKEVEKAENWGRNFHYKSSVMTPEGVLYNDNDTLYRASCPKYRNVSLNHPVQGCAAEGFKRAASRMPYREYDWRIIGWIHDANDLDLPAENLDQNLDFIAYTMLTSMREVLLEAGGADIALEIEGSVGDCWSKFDKDRADEFVVPADTPGYYQNTCYKWKLYNGEFTREHI
jgi:hypothetical protein